MTMTRMISLAALCLAFALAAGCDDPSTQGGSDPSARAAQPMDASRERASGPQSADVFDDRFEGARVWPPAAQTEITLDPNPLAHNYFLMIDVSGSMGESVCNGDERRINAAKRAVMAFHGDLSRRLPDAKIGLGAFANRVEVILPMGRHDPAMVQAALNRLEHGGGTNLVRSIQVSEAVLREQAQAQGGYGTYNLILLTDGQSGDGDPQGPARQLATNSAITVNAIGFCTGEEHSLNVPGFTKFLVADNAEQLTAVLAETVQAEQPVFDVSGFGPN